MTATTRRNELSSELSNILRQMETLVVRVAPSIAPTVPAENRAAYDALVARSSEIDEELRRIARAEAYSANNEAAITGCYNDRLRDADLPALDSLVEDE
jgi:hypothetical protein